MYDGFAFHPLYMITIQVRLTQPEKSSNNTVYDIAIFIPGRNLFTPSTQNVDRQPTAADYKLKYVQRLQLINFLADK